MTLKINKERAGSPLSFWLADADRAGEFLALWILSDNFSTNHKFSDN